MTHKKTIKVEVEITFEYDDEHFNYLDEQVAEATAKDMTIRPSRDIEDGVKLLQVCNREENAYWIINN